MDPGKQMNINRLSSDELTYELVIRGVETGTCDQMRKRLSALRKLEKSGDSFTYPPHPFTFEEDQEAIQEKIDTEVLPMIAEVDGDPSSSTVLKLHTKLSHISGRIDRMVVVSEAEKTTKARLLGKVLTIMEDLDEKTAIKQTEKLTVGDKPPSLALMENMSHSETIEHSPDHDDDATGRDIPRHSSILPIPTQPPRSIPVSKWNLTFSGERRDMSVNAFLERVEELRIARNVSKETLFDSGIDLFTGKALHWYRYVRKTEATWGGLVRRLREEFQPHNYTEKLFEEIKKRTQGPEESVGIYLAVMSAMFDRLECPVSQETQLKIIMRNLSPFYQTQLGLVEVKTISELKTLCKRLEERREAAEAYVPPTSRKTALEPDLAYLDSTPVVDAVNVPTASSSQTAFSQRKCYNCNRPGHKAIGCLEPKRLRCYGCNMEGYTRRTCPKCSAAGNERNRH